MPPHVRTVLQSRLPDRAKIVFWTLVSLGLGRVGSVEATYVEIGRLIGRQWWTVRRAVADLVGEKFLSIESIGPRFGFRFELGEAAEAIADKFVIGVTNLSGMTVPRPPPHPPCIEVFEKLSSVGSRELGPDRQTDLFAHQNTTEPDLNDAIVLGLVKRALAFDRATEAKILSVIQRWGIDAVKAAVNVAEERKAWSWGYVVKILANIPEEGIPSVRAAHPASAASPRATVAPPLEPPLSDEEIADLVEKAKGDVRPSSEGWAALAFLRFKIATGEIPPEVLSAELLAPHPEMKPAAGPVAKHPPQPVGAPSPAAPPDYTVHECARQILSESDESGSSAPVGFEPTTFGFEVPS